MFNKIIIINVVKSNLFSITLLEINKLYKNMLKNDIWIKNFTKFIREACKNYQFLKSIINSLIIWYSTIWEKGKIR